MRKAIPTGFIIIGVILFSLSIANLVIGRILAAAIFGTISFIALREGKRRW